MQLRSCVAVAVFKPIAIAPILPLARELPYAVVAALKREKKKKKGKVPSLISKSHV